MNARNISPKQFQLFQRNSNSIQRPLWAYAHELTNEPGMEFVDQNVVGGGLDHLRRVKVTSAQSRYKDGNPDTWDNPSVYESVQKHGITSPVTVGMMGKNPIINGGHNRLFAAEHIDKLRPNNPTMVPLKYDNDVEVENQWYHPRYDGQFSDLHDDLSKAVDHMRMSPKLSPEGHATLRVREKFARSAINRAEMYADRGGKSAGNDSLDADSAYFDALQTFSHEHGVHHPSVAEFHKNYRAHATEGMWD
jgi:hypothetical protein